MNTNMTGIVLAGGKSRRMGRDKAFILHEGKSFLQRTLDALKPLFSEVYIIAKEQGPFLSMGYPVFTDIFQNKGPLSAIYTGLYHAKGPVFAVACDMPFLNPQVIQFLIEKLLDNDAVVLKHLDRVHPVHGVYSRRILPVMENLLIEGRVKMMDFLRCIRTVEIGEKEILHLDPHLQCCININTPEELEECRR